MCGDSDLASLCASFEGYCHLPSATDKLVEDSDADVGIAATLSRPTIHTLHCGDARDLSWIPDESVHLVVTSPPYWTLKKYNDHPDQLGDIADYEAFLDELDKVWRHCLRVLVPGGRLVCVVGDVCLARRRNNGRHQVIPLHADISVRCRRIGFDYLTPILWYKISNATLEVDNGSSFLGKPYEPNAIIKNDIEYLLMLRKSGGYRQPTTNQRARSKMSKEEYAKWNRPFWSDITGASTRDHPAPFPTALAYRLVRMFSFVDDTVLDPFLGTGTTVLAAMQATRNSIGNELDNAYFGYAERRIRREISQKGLFHDCLARFGCAVVADVNGACKPGALASGED
jgi:site-specific DNA-methyltransferase (adenine-specific)